MKIDAWEPKHQGLAVGPWALPDARLSGADLLPGPGRSLTVLMLLPPTAHPETVTWAVPPGQPLEWELGW